MNENRPVYRALQLTHASNVSSKKNPGTGVLGPKGCLTPSMLRGEARDGFVVTAERFEMLQ